MTPRPDELDDPVAGLVAELATWRSASAPPPSPALRDLFAQTAVVAPPAAVPTRRTPMSESKRLLAAVPAKIAAGVLGALLAGSLGAGAMTGTIALTSQESDAPETTEVLADDEVVKDDGVDEEGDKTEVVEEEADTDGDTDAESGGPKDPGLPGDAPMPTSVSEAAKNHQFDEACGNHGAYVSHVARTGGEPPCATDARNGESSSAAAAETTGSADAEAAASKTKANDASATGAERSDAGKANAAANKAKAPGQAKARSGR